jgi:hypothetical protein
MWVMETQENDQIRRSPQMLRQSDYISTSQISGISMHTVTEAYSGNINPGARFTIKRVK